MVSADPSVCRKRFWGFRPGEGLLRGPPSGEGPFTGHLALPAPPDSHVSTNAVPITMNAKPMPPAERPLSRLRMATSVRFRSKQPPILTWSPGSGRFFAAVVQYRCCRPGETLAACGLWGRFRLQNRPEVALKSHPHAATSAVPARRRPKSPVSLKSAMERTTAISVLDLSMGTTLLTSPIESALK